MQLTKQDIESSSEPVTETGCWIWVGSVTSSRRKYQYGQINRNNSKIKAHRASYELFVGPIPDGMSVCHRCDNPLCVNPTHLFLGTHADNMKDMVVKKRSLHGSKHHGSKLTEEQVKWILSVKDITYKQIASVLNVSESLIKLIKTGRGWRHVQ